MFVGYWKSHQLVIYCRFLPVPDNIQRCSHCKRGKWETRSTRISLSLEDTTIVLHWLCTSCNTNLVSASSCVAFTWAKSVLVFDDFTASSSRNPRQIQSPYHQVSECTVPLTGNVQDLSYYQEVKGSLSSSLEKAHHDFPQAVWLVELIVCVVFWYHPWLPLLCFCQIRYLSVDTYNLPSILLLLIMYLPNPHRSLHYQAMPKQQLVTIHQ